MRALLVLLALLAACSAAAQDGAVALPPEDDGQAPAPGCAVDDDCVAAAATCCDCPTFAVGADDPATRACTGVTCPGQACPGNVRAACDQGACVLACVAMACPEACAAGYQMDASGCLSCACAGAPSHGCATDADCVETRADCCGCAAGGQDTAVLARDQAAFDAALACPADPACPGVDVCPAGAAPRCVQGQCELLAADALPPEACGRPDLPACPTGTVCVVNADPSASDQGVGVCAAL
jgi:hypothetical protein